MAQSSLKAAKANKKVVIEEIFWRIPHIGEKILENLCNEDLTKCRKVNNNWRNFIDEEKLLYIRKIEAYIYTSNESIRRTLHKQCLSFLKKIADEAQLTNKCSNYELSLDKSDEEKSSEILHGLLYSEKEPAGSFLFELIIENMKNKNPEDFSGRTILHTIAFLFSNEIEKFKLIMESIEDKNPKNYLGTTPLHLAAEKGYFEICKLIIQNVDVKNPEDRIQRTSLHMAEQNGHEEICNLIKLAKKS